MTCLLCCPASATRSLVTFKLLPRCRPSNEQKCHCVMTNKQCLYHVLISLLDRNAVRFICIEKKCGLETSGVHKELPVWRCEIWHRATNKSQSLKGYMLFFLLLLSVSSLSLTHTGPAAIRCLSSMYPSNPTSPPIPATSLSECISQGWQTALGLNRSLSCGGLL